MAENKNNRKSNRNFRLDKHVERHFEIEKGTDDASVMPDNTLTEPPSTPPEVGSAPIPPEPPTGDDEESKSGGSSIKWVIIVLIIVAAIAIFAYIFMSGGKDKENADKEIPQTEQNDSNQNSKNVSDSVTNSLPTTEEATPTSDAESTTTFKDGKNVSSLSDNESKTPSKKAATSSVESPTETVANSPATSPSTSSTTTFGDIEESARRVIRGHFGNGKERKAKLGAFYAEIQSKVNEMYRQGMVK